MHRSFCYSVFLISLILYLPNTCFGQASLPDSLLRVYQSEKETDAARISAIIGLGASSFTREHPDSLLAYYEDAAQLMEGRGIANDKALYVYYQGLAHYRANRFFKSLDYFEEAKELSETEQDTVQTIKALSYLGIRYKNLNDLSKSLENTREGYAVAQENGLRSNEGTILLNIGDCYFNLGDFSQAEYYIRRGVKAAEEEKEFLASIRGIVQLAHLYQDSKPDSAFYFAEKGLELARQTQNKVMEVNSLEVLYQLYEDQGNYQEALVFYKRWKMKNDTIFSEKNERAVFESEIRYTSEKQKLQDQIVFDGKLAQQKLKTQAKIYLLLGAFVLLTVAFAAFFWVVRNRSKKEKMERLDQLELIKERVAVQSVSVEGVRQELLLDKKKIEAYLGKALGDSSWDILNAIYNDPSISNREIAEEVFLSVEGVSSSLRRMYRSFKVSSGNTKNLKVALITKVVGVLMDK